MVPQNKIVKPIDRRNRHPYSVGMLKTDAIAHFGSQKALGEALGVTQPTISGWSEIVPPLQQLRLERLTGGALVADPNILPPAPETHAAA